MSEVTYVSVQPMRKGTVVVDGVMLIYSWKISIDYFLRGA